MPKNIIKALTVTFLGLALFSPKVAVASVAATAEEILTLQKSPNANHLILDVRTPGEYAEGHIRGALLIPMRDIPGKLNLLGKDKLIIVVCATGARSGAVTDYLANNGYSAVKNYRGGMSDWARKGLPIEK